MEIRWLEDALADITEIHRYIAADNPRAAARVVARIQAAIRLPADLPHRGRPGRWPGTRELIIPGTPYIVPYRVKGELVEILHLSRRPPLAGGAGEQWELEAAANVKRAAKPGRHEVQVADAMVERRLGQAFDPDAGALRKRPGTRRRITSEPDRTPV